MNILIKYHAKIGLEKELKKTNKRINELTEKLGILIDSNATQNRKVNTRIILKAECEERDRIQEALEELENEQ